jgi:hypothetical protein
VGGYDAIAQTKSAIQFIREKSKGENPFLLLLSWGPPYAPYQTAPEKYRNLYNSADIELRPNVPAGLQDLAQKEIAGYYAHIAAIDGCINSLVMAIDQAAIREKLFFFLPPTTVTCFARTGKLKTKTLGRIVVGSIPASLPPGNKEGTKIDRYAHKYS